MAKVTLPLLGVSAHGMLARQLVYRGYAGYNTARVWKGKRDAKSPAQLAQRARFQDAKELWPYLDAEQRAEYAQVVADRRLTPWHGFLSLVLDGTVGKVTVGESTVGGTDLLWVP